MPCDFVSDADPYGSKTNENNMVLYQPVAELMAFILQINPQAQ